MAIRKRKGSRFFWYEFQLNGLRFRGSTKAETREVAEAIEVKIRHDLLMKTVTGEKPEISLDVAAAKYWLEHVEVENNRPDAQRSTISILLRTIGKETLLSELNNQRIGEFVARRRGEGRAAGTINPHFPYGPEFLGLRQRGNLAIAMG